MSSEKLGVRGDCCASSSPRGFLFRPVYVLLLEFVVVVSFLMESMKGNQELMVVEKQPWAELISRECIVNGNLNHHDFVVFQQEILTTSDFSPPP